MIPQTADGAGRPQRPEPVLVTIDPTGHVRVYGDRGRLAVQVIHLPAAGESVEADLATETWLEAQLRWSHRDCYWPAHLIAHGHLARCTRPTQRLATADMLDLLRGLDRVAAKYSADEDRPHRTRGRRVCG